MSAKFISWTIRNVHGQYVANYTERTAAQALRNYYRDFPRSLPGATACVTYSLPA